MSLIPGHKTTHVPVMNYPGGRDRVHRILFQYHKGEIPATKKLVRTCDFVLCVNPNHMEFAKKAKNLKKLPPAW